MTDSIMALDVGEKRIGVALMTDQVKIPRALTTLANQPNIIDDIKTLTNEHQVTSLVVGYPRDVHGQLTAQTKFSETFADSLKDATKLPVHLQDEALTSVQAEEQLKQSGKPYKKGDIDAQAACLILEDYAKEQGLI